MKESDRKFEKLLKEYVDFLGKHIEQFYIEKFDRK